MGETFTARQKQQAAEREARMRDRVYERWVAAGKMKPNEARDGIAIMIEIANDYRAKADAEDQAGRLL